MESLNQPLSPLLIRQLEILLAKDLDAELSSLCIAKLINSGVKANAGMAWKAGWDKLNHAILNRQEQQAIFYSSALFKYKPDDVLAKIIKK